MPNSLSRIDMWNYTWGVLSTLALVGLLTYILFKVREWYSEEDEEICDWQTSLTEYRQLKEQGLITAEEFQRIKQQIISRDPELQKPGRESQSSSDGSANPVEGSHEDVREESKDAT